MAAEPFGIEQRTHVPVLRELQPKASQQRCVARKPPRRHLVAGKACRYTRHPGPEVTGLTGDNRHATPTVRRLQRCGQLRQRVEEQTGEPTAPRELGRAPVLPARRPCRCHALAPHRPQPLFRIRKCRLPSQRPRIKPSGNSGRLRVRAHPKGLTAMADNLVRCSSTQRSRRCSWCCAAYRAGSRWHPSFPSG